MTAAVFENGLDIWEQVIEQIKSDIEQGDVTAIYEMLQRVPKDVLIAYLPEAGLDK